MLLRTRDKKRLRRFSIYLSFVTLMSVSVWYIIKVRLGLELWQLIVPWALTAVFFIAWRWAKRYRAEAPKKSQRAPVKKVRRYT